MYIPPLCSHEILCEFLSQSLPQYTKVPFVSVSLNIVRSLENESVLSLPLHSQNLVHNSYSINISQNE